MLGRREPLGFFSTSELLFDSFRLDAKSVRRARSGCCGGPARTPPEPRKRVPREKKIEERDFAERRSWCEDFAHSEKTLGAVISESFTTRAALWALPPKAQASGTISTHPANTKAAMDQINDLKAQLGNLRGSWGKRQRGGQRTIASFRIEGLLALPVPSSSSWCCVPPGVSSNFAGT